MDSLLSAIGHLITLSPADEQIIRKLFIPRTLNAKEFFLEEGKICRHAGFIKKGLVRYFTTVKGEERTMSFNRENEFICYYPSFLPARPSGVGIQAIEATEIFSISFDALQDFYRDVADGERFGRLAIEQVYLSAMEEMHSLYADLPADRYLRFTQLHPDLVQRIPQYYIASFVGVKPQSLSRIRRRMQTPQ